MIGPGRGPIREASERLSAFLPLPDCLDKRGIGTAAIVKNGCENPPMAVYGNKGWLGAVVGTRCRLRPSINNLAPAPRT